MAHTIRALEATVHQIEGTEREREGNKENLTTTSIGDERGTGMAVRAARRTAELGAAAVVVASSCMGKHETKRGKAAGGAANGLDPFL